MSHFITSEPPARYRTGLVIEDDLATRHLIMRALKQMDVAAIGFGSGEAALAWVELNRTPDILLVDVQLPAMNGLRVCEWFRQMPRTRDVPILVVTSRTGAPAAAAAHALDADYLAKPFRLTELMSRVGALLGDDPHTLAVTPTRAPQSVHFWSRNSAEGHR